MTCRGRWRSCWVLLCTALLVSLWPVPSAVAVEAPEPFPTEGRGVPEVWRCSDIPMPTPTGTVTPDPEVLYDGATPPAPTATVTPPPYPLPSPTATDSRCRVTSWATPSPYPSPGPAMTVTSEPTTATEVVLAPAQFDRVDTLGSTALFAVGGLLLVLIAFAVYYLSTPPRFGLKR